MDPILSALDAALVAALNEMPDITKGKSAKVEMKGGGHYSYSYADLGDVLTAVRPVLKKHGLAVLQDVTSPGSGVVAVATIIVHTSGARDVYGPLVMPAGGTPQALGSAITYARRYALLAALGIATEDDDGQAAAKPAPEPTYSKASLDLFERIKATKGTPVADLLKGLADDAGLKLNVPTIDGDPKFAAQLEQILKEHQ